MSYVHPDLALIAATDGRYAYEAYEFLCHALAFTQEQLHRQPIGDVHAGPCREREDEQHVSARELLHGVRDYALEQFGMMAPTVFRSWGIRGTSDFGNIVFRMIDAKLWRRSSDDRLGDFDDVYDFDTVFVREYALVWEDE